MKHKTATLVAIVFLLSVMPLAIAPAQNNAVQPPRRQIAITFDDLPATHGDLQMMSTITRQLLAKIVAGHIPAIGFVNERKVDVRGEEAARTALLKQWLDQGFELGNHTYSHINMNQVSVEAYEQDVIRGETVTKRLLAERGKRLRYFRHPQLWTGPTPEYKKALEDFLAARGYTIAPVTIDNNDFMFADVYARAKARGDQATAKRVADAYLPYMESIFDFFEKLSRDALGYEVRQTLLLHANQLNADHFEALAAMMRRRGYAFITLDEALQDKAYSLPDAQVKKGLSWIHRWMIAKGMPMRPEPSEPEFIAKLFAAR